MGYAPSLRSISTHRDQRNFDEELARVERRLRRVHSHIRKEEVRDEGVDQKAKHFPNFAKHQLRHLSPDMSRGENLTEEQMDELVAEDSNHTGQLVENERPYSLRLGTFLATGTLEGVHSVKYERSVARVRVAILFGLLCMVSFGLYLYATA